jgi:PIN domain nuclease of toxin-antitoxin system
MILDTCALLWLAAGGGKLTRSTLRQIESAPAVYVSTISGFEIALKRAQGKLTLPFAPLEWFERAAQQHSLTLIPLDVEVCVRAAELPRIHDDPCDRFIIATAKLHHWEVVTTDERFGDYGVKVLR